jgi:hypothetical protein
MPADLVQQQDRRTLCVLGAESQHPPSAQGCGERLVIHGGVRTWIRAEALLAMRTQGAAASDRKATRVRIDSAPTSQRLIFMACSPGPWPERSRARWPGQSPVRGPARPR